MADYLTSWLTWPTTRALRTFRVCVVEPAFQAPAQSAGVVRGALSTFLPKPPEEETGPGRPMPRPVERFDLLTFPEAFLPSPAFLSLLEMLGETPTSLGCIHLGLRPTEDERDSHLFTTAAARDLLRSARGVAAVEQTDLAMFEQWLEAQEATDRFNLACLMFVDAGSRLRLCIHPKLVRSHYEDSVDPARHMKEANLLSLVTLVPATSEHDAVTIQPLICSDALDLTTDSGTNSPIEAITRFRDRFSVCHSERVDVVSIVACTPTSKVPAAGEDYHVVWHQSFREAVQRSAVRDASRRHNHAAFVFTNFRTIEGEPQAGLSGVFIPLPLIKSPFLIPFVASAAAICGHFSDEADNASESFMLEKDRWVSASAKTIGQARFMGLGYIVALDPAAVDPRAKATMLGMTIQRLPRDANRWRRDGNVSRIEMLTGTANASGAVEFCRGDEAQ